MNVCFYTCFVSFWYRALETSNRFVFYLPPQTQPTNRFVTAKHAPRVSAPFCGVRRPVERVLSLRPFDGWREGRGGKRSWVARPTNHLVLGSSTHHITQELSRAIQLGFDSRLVDEFGHTR